MKSPRELRAICQAGKESDPRWYAMHRRVSIYLTWALLHTRMSPNHVTILMMVVGVVGALLLASQSIGVNVAGFALLYLAFLLDKVDGEIARYRGLQSPRAVVLDRLHHLAVEPLVLLAAASREFSASGSIVIVVAAMAAIVLGNIIEEQTHLPAYALFKHLRGGRPPRTTRSSGNGWASAYALMRPLKMFRMFIVVLVSLAVVYGVQWITGWPAVRVYLLLVPTALAAYLAFQTAYYFNFKLEDDIASYQPYLTGDKDSQARALLHPDDKDALRTMTSQDLRDAPMAKPRTVTGVER